MLEEHEMDVETESLSIIKFCKPTASQEEMFSNIPFERESEFSSSPDLTPSEPTRIVMMKMPGSSNSVDQHTVDEEAVLLSPPEHHTHCHLSSSKNQNANECCTEGMTVAKAREGSVGMTEVRGCKDGLDDEPEAKRVRVEPGEEFEGEPVTLGLTGESVSIVVKEFGGLMKDGAGKFDDISGNHKSGKKRERVEIRVTGGNRPNVSSDSGWGLNIDKHEGEIITLKHIVGKKCSEVKLKSDARRSEKVDEITKGTGIPKDVHTGECVTSDGRRIAEIEEFRYSRDVNKRRERDTGETGEPVGVSGRKSQLPPIEEFRFTGDDNRRCKRRGEPVGVSGRKRQLPPSSSGAKEKVGNLEKKSGFLDLLKELNAVLGDAEEEREEVDILETAKQCGWTLPRVRWWPPDR